MTPVLFPGPGEDKTPSVPDRKAIRNEVSLTGYMRPETQPSSMTRFSFSSLWSRELAWSRPGLNESRPGGKRQDNVFLYSSSVVEFG